MSDTGDAKIRAIQQDLACPACDYNLRGLHGDVVTCPECGVTTDVARLVAERWTAPWYRAPGLNHLMLPVAWFVVGVIAFPFGAAFVADAAGVVAILMVLILGWLALMWLAAQRHGLAEGWALALLAHVIFGGYLVGVFGSLGALIVLLANLTDGGNYTPSDYAIPIIVMIVLAPLLWACRRGERFMGERCIRRHMRRAAIGPNADAEAGGAAR